MLKRKLQALDYPISEKVNINDEKEFRSIILWLEDQKIRHYKIEDRQRLRQLESEQWIEAYKQYKNDLACPIRSGKPNEELQWFLSYAVRLEYSDNKDKYRNQNIIKINVPNLTTTNPLDNLDFNSQEFRNGVKTLANLLNISATHPEHLQTLTAIRKIVSKRLNSEALLNPNSVIIKGTPFPYQDANLGFDLGDKILNQAAKVLRLLYIQNLRQLQTSINELIVAVQTITANPKTDTKLGQVGK